MLRMLGRRPLLLAATLVVAFVVGACTPPALSPPVTGVYNPIIATVSVPLAINACTDHAADVYLSITQVGVTQPLDEVYEWGTWQLTDAGVAGPVNLLAYHGQSSQPGGQLLGHVASGHCFTVTLNGHWYILGYTVSW